MNKSQEIEFRKILEYYTGFRGDDLTLLELHERLEQFFK